MLDPVGRQPERDAINRGGPLRAEPAAIDCGGDAARLAVAEAERHQTLQRSRTDMMRGLAETSTCRVQPLLAYFGEQLNRPCGHCDNCARGDAVPVAKRRHRVAPVATSRSSQTRPSPTRDDSRPYALHSTVSHRTWGRGTVLGYDDDRMTVLFDEVGYKTLSVAVVRDNDLLATGDSAS